MEITFLLYMVGWICVGILVISFIVGDVLDFLNFDFLEGTIGPTAIFGFLGTLGLTSGMLRDNTSLSLWACIGLGAVAGFIFAAIITQVISFFQKSDSGLVEEISIIGGSGYVVLTIPENGYGKIKVNNSGHSLEFAARSNVGAIPNGTQITVVDLLGPSSALVIPTVSKTPTT